MLLGNARMVDRQPDREYQEEAGRSPQGNLLLRMPLICGPAEIDRHGEAHGPCEEDDGGDPVHHAKLLHHKFAWLGGVAGEEQKIRGRKDSPYDEVDVEGLACSRWLGRDGMSVYRGDNNTHRHVALLVANAPPT